MKQVMIVTKLTGNEESDRARASEYCRFAAHRGVLPLSPYLNFHNLFAENQGDMVEHWLTARLAEQTEEIWVFGNDGEEEKQQRLKEACQEYGGKAKYFDAREIGEELLLCTMFPEKLVRRMEEMEACSDE